MNRKSSFLLVLILLVVVYTLGYKLGDSHGYADGYTEGYRYDCKDEIGMLYKRVKAQGKVIEFAQESIRKTIHENDSLRDPATAKRRYDDSVAWRKKYSSDSLKYWKKARDYNRAMYQRLGKSNYRPEYDLPFVQPDGNRSTHLTLLCLKYQLGQSKDYYPECAEGWHLE